MIYFHAKVLFIDTRPSLQHVRTFAPKPMFTMCVTSTVYSHGATKIVLKVENCGLNGNASVRVSSFLIPGSFVPH